MRALLTIILASLLAGCAASQVPSAAEDPMPTTPAPELPPVEEPSAPPLPVPTEWIAAPPPSAPEPDPTPDVDGPFATRIFDGRFEHERLDAATEATIAWRNEGNETHSVVSTDGRFPGSGPIAPGSEFAYTFLGVGDFPYHCRYHHDMAGIVVVR